MKIQPTKKSTQRRIKKKRIGRQRGRKASAIPEWRTIPLHEKIIP